MNWTAGLVLGALDPVSRSNFERDGTTPRYSNSVHLNSADSLTSRPAHQPLVQVLSGRNEFVPVAVVTYHSG